MQLITRPSLPLAVLASVRRALRRHALCTPAPPACSCGRTRVVSHVTSADEAVAADGNADIQPPPRRPAKRGKGFGAPGSRQKQQQANNRRAVDKVFEEELEASGQAAGEPGLARPEYQLYQDDQFLPKRFVGKVQATTAEGKGRVLAASARVEAGELLMLLPALSFLEGELFSAPEPEDLQVSMLDNGLTAPQRQVLALLDDGSGTPSQATLTTLDVKFWGSRGNSDPSAPTIDAQRLLRIITNCCCMDTQQDAAVMQIRQQAPLGFIGLWPEFSLIPHSCVPNTALTVVGDRMLVHATDVLKPGALLTRNAIGAMVTQPVAARQAAVLESRGYKCDCPRCQTETSASEGLRQTLEEAFAWYQDEALPQWNASQEKEDLEALQELYQEATLIVDEVEEAIQAEQGLSEEQQMWLRTAAYDCYDLLVMCDEFLNQNSSNVGHLRACLELIRVFAPGSESHTAVALKYDTITRARAELAEYHAANELKASQGQGKGHKGRLGPINKSSLTPVALVAARQAKALRSAADQASEFYFEAFCMRYGFISHQQIEMLREGLEMYTEGLEQMSVMQAQGKTEMSQDYMIDGVKFTLTDKLGSVKPGVEAFEEQVEELENRDGVQLLYVRGSEDGSSSNEASTSGHAHAEPMNAVWGTSEGDVGEGEDEEEMEEVVPREGKAGRTRQQPAGGLASAARRRQGRKMQRGQ